MLHRLTVIPISRASSRRRDVECSLAGVREATLPEVARRGLTVHNTDCSKLATTAPSECPYTQSVDHILLTMDEHVIYTLSLVSPEWEVVCWTSAGECGLV